MIPTSSRRAWNADSETRNWLTESSRKTRYGAKV
jgi:hypothetical protein